MPRGEKHDKGKPPMSWLGGFRTALGEISRIFEYGSKKYPKKDNWKYVKDSEKRYLDAAFRHLFAYASGEVIDPKSGFNHLDHAACNLLMIREIQCQKNIK